MNWFGFLGFPSEGVSFLGISLEFRHKHKLPKAMKFIIDLSPNEADHPQPLWLKLWCYRTVSVWSQVQQSWSNFRPCCQCSYYWRHMHKGQAVIWRIQSVWMKSRSFFSCALNCATQRRLTLAGQHIQAGVGGVATMATIQRVPAPPLQTPPYHHQHQNQHH